MKRGLSTLMLILAGASNGLCDGPAFPFAPAAGQSGSTAIHRLDGAFVGWANGYTNVQYGAAVDETWKTPTKALGQAEGTSYDIVCLGRGGQITLTFSEGITDGAGYDFAVFENSVSDTFLELGWVEVSSDGIHFVRFPNYSYTAGPVGSFGDVDPTYVYGFAGKYRQAYGTPFDLAELQWVSDVIAGGTNGFSSAYADAFLANYPYLDVSSVHYVRIVDVVGDGSGFDAEGYIVYDPYPTTGSAGFDLDAIGVIHQPAAEGLSQSIVFDPVPHQKLAFGSSVLHATADSGLPVTFSIVSGPAILSDDILLTFAGTGTVVVAANQPGDATFAPAPQVLRSFEIADEIQHVFVEPVPYQLVNTTGVLVRACSSSGLPVGLEVYSGPADVSIGMTNHILDIADTAGLVVLRAYQAGDTSHAPAEDVFVQFQIVENGATNAPLSLSQWAASNSVPSDGLSDSDDDGVIDIQEFVLGGDPNSQASAPIASIALSEDVYGRPAMLLSYPVDLSALGRSRFFHSTDLLSWTNTVPEIVGQDRSGSILNLQVLLPADETNGCYRLMLEEQ